MCPIRFKTKIGFVSEKMVASLGKEGYKENSIVYHRDLLWDLRELMFTLS